VKLAQLIQIPRKHHCQDSCLEVVTTLLERQQREISFMPMVDDQKADLPANLRRHPDCKVADDEETPADSIQPVIELGDLTTGPEVKLTALSPL